MQINRQELFKTTGYFGVALLLAGYLRYSVLETLDTISKSLLIAGAVLTVAGLALNFRAIRHSFGQRSTRLGTNMAAITVAVVAILVLLNFLGYRHHKRVDVTAEKLYSLSDQTRKIVSGLPKDVKIIKFAEDEDTALRDRMQEYRDLSKRLSYERIDPQIKPEIARQYKVSRMGEMIVASGDRIERPQGDSEQELTNAILKVTRDSLKTICFVEGHGEKKLGSGDDGEGYGVVDRLLKRENYETKTISLVTGNQVPAECAVLVEAGPKQPLLPPEAAMIGKYLDAGGKAFLLFDPETDPQVGDVLKAWNITLGQDTVLDVSAAGQMYGGGPFAPLVMSYGAHPITKDFGKTMTIFPLADSVKVASSAKTDVSTTELLKTSEQSWAETELKSNEDPKFDEGKDLRGPVSLGVAASKKMADKEGRLVVIGDSDFATNRVITFQRNRDLFMNTINWLAQDEDLIAIRPKSPTDRRVTMTESQQNIFFWITLLLMPGVVIGSGAYIWWKRR